MHASNHLTAARDAALRHALRKAAARAAAILRGALPQHCELCAARERPRARLRRLRGGPPRGRSKPVRCARCLPSGDAICGACLSAPPPFSRHGRRARLRVSGRPPDPAHQIRRQHRARRLGGGAALAAGGAREALSTQPRRASRGTIVALPLAAARQRERGFNQAGEIAARVAAADRAAGRRAARARRRRAAAGRAAVERAPPQRPRRVRAATAPCAALASRSSTT